MNAEELKEKLDASLSMQLIVAGLAGLIDDEGYTFHETVDILEDIKRHTFPALMEMSRENKND